MDDENQFNEHDPFDDELERIAANIRHLAQAQDQDNQEEHPDSTQQEMGQEEGDLDDFMNDTEHNGFFAQDEEAPAYDNDLREMEENHQSEKRAVANLKDKCRELLDECNRIKQAIVQEKRTTFAVTNNCLQDVELMLYNIESDTCENIKTCATDIAKNIRRNKSAAEDYLEDLNKHTRILSLQFDYINTAHKFSTNYEAYKGRAQMVKEAEPYITQDLPRIRLQRQEEAMRRREAEQVLAKIRQIQGR